jgi:CBS domain-containing protein
MKTAEDILNEKDKTIISADPEMSVRDAVQLMSEKHIGSVFVKEGSDYVGVYTERDLLRDSADTDFNADQALLRDRMTRNLLFVAHDTPILKLQDLILGKRVRHLLVKKDKKTIGLLSAGDIMKAHMNQMSKELESVSWDYYENWCFKKKR